ncbi:hypothetical protein ACFPH6_42300 [Streptomyces xiangluensis]|uniref:Uncharacterized protein n=1 Tax=Streptomyces xiangluensis TaxID=2665720 RepID=A0ABV8Z3Y6_9ACTN
MAAVLEAVFSPAAADSRAGRICGGGCATTCAIRCIERTRFDAQRAERAIGAVEPETRLVARTLETCWEARLTGLAETEAALASVRESRPVLPDQDHLRTGATDVLDIRCPHSSAQARRTPQAARELIARLSRTAETDHQMYRRTIAQLRGSLMR